MNIEIERIFYRYKGIGATPNYVLEDVSLTLTDGEFVGLVGASGSGKTTLMQHLTGLLKPDRGQICIDGLDLWGKKFEQERLRCRIGLVFQFPEAQLFEPTLYDDVAFGPRNMRLPDDEIDARVRQAFERVGLKFENFRGRSPLRLSEGEKRKAALAGVIAMQPELLALDEPTAGLDHRGVKAVVKIMQDYHNEGKSVLFISHDLDLMAALARRVIVLEAGRVKFDGPKSELFRRPELLTSTGLAFPRFQMLLQELKKRHWVGREEIYNLSDLQEALIRHARHRNVRPETLETLLDVMFQNPPVSENQP